MLLAFNRVFFVLILYLISCVSYCEQYGEFENTLYVSEDVSKSDRRMTVINRFTENESSGSYRRKREATTVQPVQGNVSTQVSDYFLFTSHSSPCF